MVEHVFVIESVEMLVRHGTAKQNQSFRGEGRRKSGDRFRL